MLHQLGPLCDVRYTFKKLFNKLFENLDLHLTKGTEPQQSLLVVTAGQILVNEMWSKGHLVLIYTSSKDPLQLSSSSQTEPFPFLWMEMCFPVMLTQGVHEIQLKALFTL